MTDDFGSHGTHNPPAVGGDAKLTNNEADCETARDINERDGSKVRVTFRYTTRWIRVLRRSDDGDKITQQLDTVDVVDSLLSLTKASFTVTPYAYILHDVMIQIPRSE